MVGLSRRVPATDLQGLTLDEANDLKLGLQDRVLELWGKNQHMMKQGHNVSTETLLQVLECKAEDEMWLERQIDIEILERYIRHNTTQGSHVATI